VSTERLFLRVVREYPEEGMEVVAADGPDLRMSLWRGLEPSRYPRHPCLGRVVHTGRLDGERIWLESRPAGALLCDLLPLAAPELAQIGAEISRAIYALDKWGLVHGRISANRIVVGGDGRPQLLGAQFSGDSDLEGLWVLLRDLWPDSEAFPVLDESTGAISDSLESYLREAHPEYAPFRLGARSWEQAPRPEVECAQLEVELDVSTGTAADEVTFDIGPDPVEPGLLDQWDVYSGSQVTDTREWTMAGEGEMAGRRRSMVALLVSPPAPLPDPDRFDAVEGSSCEPVKRLLSDEPFDPLPMPDGIRPELPPELISREREVVEEHTYTATVTRFTEVIPIRAIQLAVVALVGSTLFLLATIYRFFF
jgi:hypothetical protein